MEYLKIKFMTFCTFFRVVSWLFLQTYPKCTHILSFETVYITPVFCGTLLQQYKPEWQDHKRIGKMLKGSGRGLIEILSQHLLMMRRIMKNFSFRITKVTAEIRTLHLPNISNIT
jgi:hypothetical protein